MTKDKVEQIVLDSGLWDAGRRSTHGFILSPSVFQISKARGQEFEKIGVALHECLAGMGRIIHIAANPQLAHNKTWRMLSRVSRVGIPKIYHEIQLLKPSKVLAICKVDFMEDVFGKLYIAEIDGHNKHGLGYSTLGARIRQVVAPDAEAFSGVAASLAKVIQKKTSGNNKLTLLYSDQERFYLPEFKILQDDLAKNGMTMSIIVESAFDFSRQGKGLFLDFPFCHSGPSFEQKIANAYQEEKIDFLIPPKPFLGSKAMLALLRNDENNEELETILRSQIPINSLELLRSYIPETYLITKGISPNFWTNLCDGRPFVLKAVISSGMKGTEFSDDMKFTDLLQKASSSYYLYIMQREITNRPQLLRYFGENGDCLEDNWFARITTHYSLRQVADIIVTARRDKKVHGALDCLQISATVV